MQHSSRDANGPAHATTLEAPLLPLILKLAAPNVSGFLAQSAVILVEVWMIGQLGTEPLAAIALVFPLLILLLTVSGGAVGGAISSSVACYLGAGDADSAGRLMWQAVILCFAAAYAGFLLIYALFGAAFLGWMGDTGNIAGTCLRGCSHVGRPHRVALLWSWRDLPAAWA